MVIRTGPCAILFSLTRNTCMYTHIESNAKMMKTISYIHCFLLYTFKFKTLIYNSV